MFPLTGRRYIGSWFNFGNGPSTDTLLTSRDDLNKEDQELLKKLTILDSIEFLHDFVLPKLKIRAVDEDVVLHPNCSARKLGLDAKMMDIAIQCAKSALVPL